MNITKLQKVRHQISLEKNDTNIYEQIKEALTWTSRGRQNGRQFSELIQLKIIKLREKTRFIRLVQELTKISHNSTKSQVIVYKQKSGYVS